MVNAFTFDNGSPRQFSTRKEMYDWMIENGHIIEEGDDAPKFKDHVKKAQGKGNAKAAAIIARLEE